MPHTVFPYRRATVMKILGLTFVVVLLVAGQISAQMRSTPNTYIGEFDLEKTIQSQEYQIKFYAHFFDKCDVCTAVLIVDYNPRIERKLQMRRVLVLVNKIKKAINDEVPVKVVLNKRKRGRGAVEINILPSGNFHFYEGPPA